MSQDRPPSHPEVPTQLHEAGRHLSRSSTRAGESRAHEALMSDREAERLSEIIVQVTTLARPGLSPARDRMAGDECNLTGLPPPCAAPLPCAALRQVGADFVGAKAAERYGEEGQAAAAASYPSVSPVMMHSEDLANKLMKVCGGGCLCVCVGGGVGVVVVVVCVCVGGGKMRLGSHQSAAAGLLPVHLGRLPALR